MQKSKSNSGFTLIELMITVSIIVIIAAAAIPGFTASLAENKASTLAEDIVRLGRRAKAEPMGTGRAHMLSYARVEPSGNLTLFGGNSNLCNLVTNWGSPMDRVDAQDYSGQGDPTKTNIIDFRPRLVAADTDLGNVQLCYQPDGKSMIRIGTGALFTESISPSGSPISEFLFKVTRTQNSIQRGVIRYVLFPYCGSARIYLPPEQHGETEE